MVKFFWSGILLGVLMLAALQVAADSDLIADLGYDKELKSQVHVTASSAQSPGGGQGYGVGNLAAEKVGSWCEGAPRDGIGEAILFTFDPAVKNPRQVDIVNGMAELPQYSNNSRVKTLEIILSDGSKTSCDVADTRFANQHCWLTATNSPITSARFIIRDVHHGNRYKDTCINHLRMH